MALATIFIIINPVHFWISFCRSSKVPHLIQCEVNEIQVQSEHSFFKIHGEMPLSCPESAVSKRSRYAAEWSHACRQGRGIRSRSSHSLRERSEARQSRAHRRPCFGTKRQGAAGGRIDTPHSAGWQPFESARYGPGAQAQCSLATGTAGVQHHGA